MDELARAFPDGLSHDDFLGGKLTVTQPVSGYRAGVDPVFLAAALAAREGQQVLDLGCGVGTAGLCVAARVKGVSVSGVERQCIYADLARHNAAANSLPVQIHNDDIFSPTRDWARESFDIVMTNPPYFQKGTRTPSPDAMREAGLGEERPLVDWLDIAVRRLLPGGTLGVIQRADRLDALLAGLDQRVGAVEIRPLAPRQGRPARLVIVTAKKGAGAPLTLHAPVVLHQGDRHTADGESYTQDVSAVLRKGAPWPWIER